MNEICKMKLLRMSFKLLRDSSERKAEKAQEEAQAKNSHPECYNMYLYFGFAITPRW